MVCPSSDDYHVDCVSFSPLCLETGPVYHNQPRCTPVARHQWSFGHGQETQNQCRWSQREVWRIDALVIVMATL